MLDGIAAAEILRGVRAPKPVDRRALSSMIERVSSLIADFPEISELDLNPVFATEHGAAAADVRIVLNFNPAPARDRPNQADIVEKMNRIMKPKALAVIGASAENGKIGNSVMKNLINGGLCGEYLPHSSVRREHHGKEAYKSVKDVPGDIDVAGLRDSREIRGASSGRGGRKENRRRHSHPFRIRGNRECRGPERIDRHRRKYGVRLMGPNIYGFYYTPSILRDVLHRLRRERPRSPVSQSGGIEWRLSAFHVPPRWVCPRSSGSATSPTSTRTISSRSFEAGSEYDHHRAALRRPEGWPLVRRGGQTRFRRRSRSWC